jgi:hypothetical protein
MELGGKVQQNGTDTQYIQEHSFLGGKIILVLMDI